jgi:hypothetical protein
MTLLQEIIDHSTDDNVSTTNLLRKVEIAAHRLKASELLNWSRNELNGYPSTVSIPSYRDIVTPVMSQWTGVMGSGVSNIPLSASPSMDQDLSDFLFHVKLTQPIQELHSLSKTERSAAIAWPAEAIVYYNDLVEKGKATSVSNFNLFCANKIIPQNTLQGIVDIVRNKVLDLALDLQETDAESGEQDGPTVGTPDMEKTVFNITNNIYGNNTNVAAGESVQQQVTIQKGNVKELLDGVRQIIQDEGVIDSIEKTATKACSVEEKRSVFKKIIGAITNGATQIAKDTTTAVAASVLTRLFAQFLGLPTL